MEKLVVKAAPGRDVGSFFRPWMVSAVAGMAVAVSVAVWGLWPTPASPASPVSEGQPSAVTVPPLVWFRLGQAISPDIAAASCRTEPSPEKTPATPSPVSRFDCDKSFDPNGPNHLHVMLVTDNDPATDMVAGRLDVLFNTVVADNTAGPCKPEQKTTPYEWHGTKNPDQALGKLLCSPQNAVIAWTRTSNRSFLVASRDDHNFDKLDTWWLSYNR